MEKNSRALNCFNHAQKILVHFLSDIWANYFWHVR